MTDHHRRRRRAYILVKIEPRDGKREGDNGLSRRGKKEADELWTFGVLGSGEREKS